MDREPYVQQIEAARVYELARRTDLQYLPTLSEQLSNSIWLKREDQQPGFSFKIRGAYNKISQLSEAARRCGIIAASAGNHAQGVALTAQALNIRAIAVVPRTTPRIKVAALRRMNVETILFGERYDEAYSHALLIAHDRGLTFIHPYDDALVIAGQGTVGREILDQHPGPLHAVFVPVGGGGLIAGVAAYIKNKRPDVRIIGVEPTDAATLHEAMRCGQPIELSRVGGFADGVAVRQIGAESFRLARDYVDEVVLVSSDEICLATKHIFNDTRVVAEPAGALGIAGIRRYLQQHEMRDMNVAAILSGANVDFSKLIYIAERAEFMEQAES